MPSYVVGRLNPLVDLVSKNGLLGYHEDVSGEFGLVRLASSPKFTYELFGSVDDEVKKVNSAIAAAAKRDCKQVVVVGMLGWDISFKNDLPTLPDGILPEGWEFWER